MSNLTNDDRAEIYRIFKLILDEPTDERLKAIKDYCADNVVYERELNLLLSAHNDAHKTGFLREPLQYVPTNIGRYRVLRVLGSGAMGIVYLAIDPDLDRKVALKILPYSKSLDTSWISLFEREAKLLAKINHPNIATIFSIEKDGDDRFIAMEYIEGESLAARLARGPLSLQESLSVGVKVASALSEAHRNGIIHRDIKPLNIMITDDNQIKVLDFGLAKSLFAPHEKDESRTKQKGAAHIKANPDVSLSLSHSIAIGTPGYMSPEQIQRSNVDERTDCFSFACCLFECFTGKPVFHEIDTENRLKATLERDPDFDLIPQEIPSHIVSVLKRCLSRDRNQRPKSMAYVCDILSKTLNTSMQTSTSSKRAVRGSLVILLFALAVFIIKNLLQSEEALLGGLTVIDDYNAGDHVDVILALQSNKLNDGFGYGVVSAGDINGDNIEDIIMTSHLSSEYETEAGMVRVLLSTDDKHGYTAVCIYGESATDQFGLAAAPAGDMNGDGYGDVAIGAPYHDSTHYYRDRDAGKVYIFFGSRNFDATPDVVLDSGSRDALFGNSCACAGDINADGYSDVIVGAYAENKAYLYYGGENVDSKPDIIHEHGAGHFQDRYGYRVAGIGDLNADGYDDYAISASHANVDTIANAGRVYIYLGGENGQTDPHAIIDGKKRDEEIGILISTLGDINKDKAEDYVIGCSVPEHDDTGASCACLFSGAPPYGASPALCANGAAGARSAVSICSLDLNGDGLLDVLLAIQYFRPNQDVQLNIAYGSEDGMEFVKSHPLQELSSSYQMFGSSICTISDIKKPDSQLLVVGSPGYANDEYSDFGHVFFIRLPVVSPN